MRSILFTLLVLIGFATGQDSLVGPVPGEYRKTYSDSLYINDSGSYWEATQWLEKVLPRATVVKNVSELTSSRGDSIGSIRILKQLSDSNTRGGGAFILRPASEYVVDNVAIFESGGSAEWVRLRVYEGGPVYLTDAGAVGDGSTADEAAMELAEASARATTRKLFIPKGVFRVNASTWQIANASQDVGLVIYGAGEFSSIIEGGPSLAGRVVQIGNGSARSRNITMRNISIRSAAASDADTLLALDLVGNLDLKLRVGQSGYNAKLLIYGEQVEHSDFHLDALYAADGVEFGGTTNNGIRIFGGIGQVDNVAFRAIQFKGSFQGEGGNCDTFLVAGQGTVLSIDGSNLENCDSVFFHLQDGADLNLSSTRILGTNSHTDDLVARLENESTYLYWGMGNSFQQINAAADSQIVVEGNRSDVYALPFIESNGTTNIPNVYKTVFSAIGIIKPRLWSTISEASGLVTAAVYDELRGQAFFRQSIAGQDRFIMPVWADSGSFEADLLLGSYQKWGSNTTSPSTHPEGHKTFYGNRITTFTTANSPTDLVIDVDNGGSGVGVEDVIYVSAPSIMHITGQDSVVVDSLVTLKSESAGTFTYRFYHHNMAGNAAANAEVQYYFIVKD